MCTSHQEGEALQLGPALSLIALHSKDARLGEPLKRVERLRNAEHNSTASRRPTPTLSPDTSTPGAKREARLAVPVTRVQICCECASHLTDLPPGAVYRYMLEQDELEELKSELQVLNIKIKEGQQMAADKTFQEALKDIEKEAKFRVKQRRVLKGHISKVTSAHFCGDSKKAVSGSLDGKLIIWDVFSGNKMRVIPLRSSWVMACAYDELGNYVAVGGMDNMCTVYDLRGTNAKVQRELAGMDGYLSSVRFLGDSQVITGSGDTNVVLWDLERGQKVVTFEAHEATLSPCSMQLWDIRQKECRQTFREHEGDVSSVCFHTGGNVFATASEDKSCRLFDVRSDQQLSRYQNPRESSAFTSCGLSLSGRLLFAGADDHDVHVWDTLSTRRVDNPTVASVHTHPPNLREIIKDELASMASAAHAPSPARFPVPSYAEVASRAPAPVPTVPADVGCDHVAAMTTQAPRPRHYSTWRPPRPICFYCGIKGHISRFCRRRQQDERRGYSANERDYALRPDEYDPTPYPSTSRALTGHENKVTALTISPDGAVVVTGSWDSSVRVWG
ncbi:hypothetical protein HPB51_017474 [Rhipicephalus microplus]|uniref:CCHC-type domain-containing protein n=1 Tax=Rhipicephalus microplus TaxID=6941 RepID=A0A9J6F7R0_RHIMP|nr:hypothetical protein HPB51_017474 [Rhipicephalus microplus]